MTRRGPIRTLFFIALLIAFPSLAQISTATIRGKVSNEKGNTVANAEINAVGTQSGFVRTVHSAPDGSYTLPGLTPGEYNIVVAAPGYEPRSETVTVRVGQTLDMNLRLTPTAVVNESITVVGNQLIETKTSEAATNVTPQQIESLPQNDRNFLNFAAMAPGVRVSNDPLRKTFASDAQPAEQTNVFIDGVSMKNDVLQGGVAGQDSSRGNPFPQNAVQEFRVITQNYSAQYEKASSAIITAVTKSGGNEIDGQAFLFWQPKGWVAPQPLNFGFDTNTTNATYRRWQDGVNVGGPIIKDRLHYFLSYEGDDEHATKNVALGNQNFASQFGQFQGVFPAPFRSNLFFGKLSWQPASNQIVDVSDNYRHEHEIRDFSGQTSYQSSTDLRNAVYGTTLRHQWNNNSALNQATASLQRYYWNPTPTNPDLVGLNYQGVIRIGGNSSYQKFDQRRFELRDDYNFATYHLSGDHNFQVGANVDWASYKINKSLFGNPEYEFQIAPAQDRDFSQPFEVNYGFGNPNLSIGNHEYGIYGQDQWIVNPHLNLNLGLRWDYETNMLDQSYVTPANVVAGLAGHGEPAAGLANFNDYLSNGNSRSAFKGEFQPRLGFTYDLRADSRTVIFGGAGRYYDRLFLNATLDERYRLQFPVYRIEFSKTGDPAHGIIKWDPAYSTPAGLNALIASGVTSPEVYLLNNNTKPPYSNQFNLGVRQAFGDWLASLSYNGVRGYRGFTWVSGAPDGLCCRPIVPGLGNVIISDPSGGKRYWYDGAFFTLDRPYTNQTRWGAHIAWTHGRATQNGNDLFSLDYPTASQYPRHVVEGTERDRIVATGIWGLPMDFRFSTIVTLGSGAAKPLLNFSQGFSLANRQASNAWGGTLYPERTWGFADRSVDFRLEKDFPVWSKVSLGIIGEAFNAFNWNNYGCLNNFLGPDGNPSLGQPTCMASLGRREQLGFRARF